MMAHLSMDHGVSEGLGIRLAHGRQDSTPASTSPMQTLVRGLSIVLVRTISRSPISRRVVEE